MHVQANQAQYLPSIDSFSGGYQQKPFKSKNVKPDYYKNRRKANYTNMFEVFDDDTQTMGQGGQTTVHDNDSSKQFTVDHKRSIEETDDNQTIGTIQVTDAASHKFTTEKKRKGYFTDGKNTKLNFMRGAQNSGGTRQSLPTG